MTSINNFQIFQNRNIQDAEQQQSRGTPNRNRVNIRPTDTPKHGQEFNESSCGSGSAHLELTQQESEEFTQHSNTNSAVKKKPVEPGPVPQAWGMLRRQGGLQEEFELHHRVVDAKRDTYTIGRSSKSDITVADTWVSTTHCMVYCDYAQPKLRIFIEDCSANGTYVNDSLTRLRKNERMELKSGDQIYLLNPRKEENLKKTHASFVFINLRERLVALREISYAPEHLIHTDNGTDQYAMTTQLNTHHNTSRVFSTILSHQHAPHIEDKYIIGDQIGCGMSGQVYFCVNKLTHEQFAVKMIETKKFSLNPGLSVADLREEASLMREFDHPNIIKVVDSFQSDTMIYIVMEWLRGGDLFDRIMERERYTEDTARQLMKQVFSAVEYLHAKNIIHRDLKPENILLVSNKSDVDVKVTDFGLAKKANREGLKTFCGTPQYFAPEVLQRKHQDKTNVQQLSRYGKAVDMWSLGVVLYILLSGSFPFGDDEEILRANYSLSGVEWDGISPGAKHLIRSLMTLNVHERFTVQQALRHPWISGIEYAPSGTAVSLKDTVAAAGPPATASKKRPPVDSHAAANNTTNNANYPHNTSLPATSPAATTTTTKRVPTAATTLKRASSNLQRVNSYFAPLELKHKTSLVYAAAAHNTGTNPTPNNYTTNISSCNTSVVTTNTTRSSGYPPLPPASEVFTMFGKNVSPIAKRAAADATVVSMKPLKQRKARKGKASTTDDIPCAITSVQPSFSTYVETVATSIQLGASDIAARIVPITESPTDYIDLSHSQFTSTIQLTTSNSSIVHLTVCNSVSCLDAFLPIYGVSRNTCIKADAIVSSTTNTSSVTDKPEFKRSTSFADSTIVTSPTIRSAAIDNTPLTLSTPNLASTPSTATTANANYVLNSKSPGFTIIPKVDINIDPYDDVIEDYSSSEEVPNSSHKSREKPHAKRQKRGNSGTATVVLTKPPLSGGKDRAKGVGNKPSVCVLGNTAVTSADDIIPINCATPTYNCYGTGVTDADDSVVVSKGRKRSVSFSDHAVVLNNEPTTDSSVVGVHEREEKVSQAANCNSTDDRNDVGDSVTAARPTTTPPSVIDNPLPVPANKGIKRMQSSLEQAWKIKPSVTKTIVALSRTNDNGSNETDIIANAEGRVNGKGNADENIVCPANADIGGSSCSTKDKTEEPTEKESVQPPAKKLRVPMKSLTELFRMNTKQ